MRQCLLWMPSRKCSWEDCCVRRRIALFFLSRIIDSNQNPLPPPAGCRWGSARGLQHRRKKDCSAYLVLICFDLFFLTKYYLLYQFYTIHIVSGTDSKHGTGRRGPRRPPAESRRRPRAAAQTRGRLRGDGRTGTCVHACMLRSSAGKCERFPCPSFSVLSV